MLRQLIDKIKEQSLFGSKLAFKAFLVVVAIFSLYFFPVEYKVNHLPNVLVNDTKEPRDIVILVADSKAEDTFRLYHLESEQNLNAGQLTEISSKAKCVYVVKDGKEAESFSLEYPTDADPKPRDITLFGFNVLSTNIKRFELTRLFASCPVRMSSYSVRDK